MSCFTSISKLMFIFTVYFSQNINGETICGAQSRTVRQTRTIYDNNLGIDYTETYYKLLYSVVTCSDKCCNDGNSCCSSSSPVSQSSSVVIWPIVVGSIAGGILFLAAIIIPIIVCCFVCARKSRSSSGQVLHSRSQMIPVTPNPWGTGQQQSHAVNISQPPPSKSEGAYPIVPALEHPQIAQQTPAVELQRYPEHK